MRRVTLVLVALILAVPQMNAQIGVGAKLGTNIANTSIDPDPGDTKSSYLGLVFGGVVEIGLGGPVYLQPEVLYIRKGMKREGVLQYMDDFGGTHAANYTVKTRVSFIEVPLLVKAKFLTGGVRPYAFAGPSFGFRLKASNDVDITGVGTQEVDLKDQTSSVDIGVAFGAGAEFRIAPSVGLTADVRYALGLTDVQKEQGNEPDIKVKTRGIQVLAGIVFFL